MDLYSSDREKNGSDTDESPVKSKSSRRRGLAARLKSSKSIHDEKQEISDHATVYSTKVSKMFETFKSGPVGSLSLPLVTSMIKHDMSTRKISHRTENSKAKGGSNDPGYDPDDIIQLDLETDELPSTPKMAKTTADLVKSPTPPPPPSPPPEYSQPYARRTRMSKCLKNAIRNICDAKEHLVVEERVSRLGSSDDQDIVCLDDEIDEDTLTVRIKHGRQTYRYPIRKSEPFKRVISEIADKMDINSNRVLLVLNDKTIHSYDSPTSLGLQVADIVYCHISSNDRSILEDSLTEENGTNQIKLYVQSRNSKQKQEFLISRNQPIDEIVRKYSIQTNIDPSHLKLHFDGEDLTLSDTPDELELEDGYCLDIIHVT